MNEQQADNILKTFPRQKAQVKLLESDDNFREYLSRVYDNRENLDVKTYVDKLKTFLSSYLIGNNAKAESKFWASKIAYAIEAGSDYNSLIARILDKEAPAKFFDTIRKVKTAKLNEVL